MSIKFACAIVLLACASLALGASRQPTLTAVPLGPDDERAEAQIAQVVAGPDRRLFLTGTSYRAQPFERPSTMLVGAEAGVEKYAFVACFDSQARVIVWSAVLPGDVIEPTRIAVLSNGSVVLAGKQGAAFKSLPNAKRPDGVWYDNSTVGVMLLSADGKSVRWANSGSPNQVDVTGLAVDADDQIYWTGSPRDQGMGAYVQRVNASGKPIDFPLSGGKPHWSIGLHPETAELNAPGQYFDHYNKAKQGGYDYDGPGKGYGKITWKLHGFRRGGQLLILPDGDLIVSAALQYRFWAEGGETSPEFDLFVARYRNTGELVWSTNLYRPGDAVQGTDKKPLALAYDVKSDEVIVVGAQHGSDHHRLYSKDFDLAGDSGNMMLCLDPSDVRRLFGSATSRRCVEAAGC